MLWDWLERGDWVSAWHHVAAGATVEQQAIRAMLLAQWWDAPLDARDQAVRAKSLAASPLTLYADAYVALLSGDGEIVPRLIAMTPAISETSNPTWVRHWLMIEHAGRSRDFEQQALLVRKVMERPTTASLGWLYLACLFSLGPEVAIARPLRKVMNNNKSANPLYHLLCTEFSEDATARKARLNDLLKRHEADYWISLHFSSLLASTSDVISALRCFDQLAQRGQLDGRGLLRWMALALSHPATFDTFEARFHYALRLAPNTLRYQGVLAAYGLVNAWIKGKTGDAYQIYSRTQEFSAIELTKNDQSNRVFYNYILSLFLFKQKNPQVYSAVGESFYFIGESHSLSPLGAVIKLLPGIGIGRTCFTMGVKMFHLGQKTPNVFSSCVTAHVRASPETAKLVFTIGEIDCRVNEGIWPYCQKNGIDYNNKAAETVAGYVAFLRNILAGRNTTLLTVQGIPAPAHALEGLNTADERRAYLGMIRHVNDVLKAEVLASGWSFLDVYAATVGEDGRSHGELHLDGYHLKPSFYQQANRWLVQPTP